MRSKILLIKHKEIVTNLCKGNEKVHNHGSFGTESFVRNISIGEVEVFNFLQFSFTIDEKLRAVKGNHTYNGKTNHSRLLMSSICDLTQRPLFKNAKGNPKIPAPMLPLKMFVNACQVLLISGISDLPAFRNLFTNWSIIIDT